MAAYTARNFWRIRFLDGEGSYYSLRNLQFRRFSTADPVSSCGTVEECRAGAEAALDYNEQAEGTRATDLFLYGGGGVFDAGWSSLEHPGGLPDNVYIAREYPEGRDVAYIGLISTSGSAQPTRISRFAIDYSDNGEDWIESRVFETDPDWGSNETRVFALPSADDALPVFSFRANRREPMPERLSFLTDVLRASGGAEQRRSLRPTPRRTFEADFLLTGRERTFWDLFFNTLAGQEVMVPLYWESLKLDAPLTAGVSDRINFNTTYREWQYGDGDLALLMGDSALDYEKVQLFGVDDNGINLALPVSRPWPRGTRLVLLRRGVIDEWSDPAHKSAGVSTATAQFRITVQNPWTPEEDDSDPYEGLPVFTDEPNWVDDLAVNYAHEIVEMDAQVGLPYRVDRLDRALVGQAHRFFLTGRQRLARFRDLIYRHRGRAGAFWLPTFKADLKMIADVGAAATQIEVENVGYLYTGGPTSGREYIAIKHDGGTILRKVLSVVPGSTAATEKLNLDAAMGLDLAAGQVRRISFADVARFDTDEFEITHHGGIDGHHDVSTMFRTFKNTRTAPEPISEPIPAGSMDPNACGDLLLRPYWRVYLRENSTDRYTLRHLEFRKFGAVDTELYNCGSLANCRSLLRPGMIFDSELAGTEIADLTIYGSGGYWSSEIGVDECFVGINFPAYWPTYAARPVGTLILEASPYGDVRRTSISAFDIQYSDDGVNWITTRSIVTSGAWAAGETREWSLY